MEKVNCKKCGKCFEARSSHLKRGWGKYCSNECHYLSMKTGKCVECEVCSKTTYKSITELSHSKSGKFFCTKSCQTVWRNKQYSGSSHKLWKGGISNDYYRDIMERIKVVKICKLCNTKDFRVLAVHHIDNNHSNNKIDNLVYLCHNCHQMVHIDTKENEKLLSMS